MRTIIIILLVVCTVNFTSCATTDSVTKNSSEVAGYTLKNKKELLQQKVLNTKSKTVIAQP
ncbi:MAG: hypothetical protein R2776_00665 [Flavobacteriaceae bacterium]|nr:hypothetical protein [Flavobacteriaceae bacterium]